MADDDASAEAARAKAEARRKRILESSGKRMGIVSGEQTQSPTEEEGGTTTTTTSSSGASRLQAMRRRRFKKSQKAVDADSKPKEETEAPVSSNGDDAPAETGDQGDATKGEATDAPLVEKTSNQEETVETKSVAPLTTTTQKKYKGVARMRRQMIKEKQKSEAQAVQDAIPDVEPPVAKAPVSKYPIIMHMITVLVLFLVGFDIGYDQFVHPDVVQFELAPVEFGVGMLNRRLAQSIDPKDLLQESQAEWDHPEDEPDEFGLPEGASTEKNIDPLFQVDLDDFTRGEGLFWIIARAAVSVHRFNLLLLFYTPRAVLTAVVRIPQKLMATPPVLFLVCLVLRQVAKRVLGANLPDPPDETDKQDILALAKQSLMSFVSNTFPTAVGLYDAFTHLRSDMLIVLCGIFTALAVGQTFGRGVLVHDEL